MTKALKAIRVATVIARSVVTWGVVAVAIAQVVIDNLSGDISTPLEVAARIAAIVAGSVAVLRRVTPVDPSERGVLPPGG